MNEQVIKDKLSMGVSPSTLLHGYLKELMYDLQCVQEDIGNTDNAYYEGRADALAQLYDFSIKLSYAVQE